MVNIMHSRNSIGATWPMLAVILAIAPASANAQDDPCCTEAEVTECQDGLWCTGEESCNCYGDCEPGIPRNCDDGDWCTEDYCINDVITPGTGVGEGHCEHHNICINCETDADCDDGNACTDEWCDSNICFYEDVVCNDSLGCTEDTCDPATGCVFTDICSDADPCTNEYCDAGTGMCEYPPVDCDDGDVCTVEYCDSSTGLCVYDTAPGVCTNDLQCELALWDGKTCTVEFCDFGASPCAACARTVNPQNDTCSDATQQAASGSGSSMSWVGGGDLACNNDDYGAPVHYPSTPCGDGVGPDAVWTLSVPSDYQLHRYRLSGYDPLTSPDDFDAQVCLYYPYRQSLLTPTNAGVCGPGANETYALDDERVLMCADVGGPSCGHDFTDACTDIYRWHSGAGAERWPVLPDGSYNLLVDTGKDSTAGRDYSYALERVEAVDNHACSEGGEDLPDADAIEPVEIQMGGVWTGNTLEYGRTMTLEGVGFCTQTEMSTSADPDPDYSECMSVNIPGGCGCDGGTYYECFYKEYARAEFRIDHTAPWNRSMGYVISTENNSFDTALSLMGASCSKGCGCSWNGNPSTPMSGCWGDDAAGCPVACDDDSSASGGGASRLVTGVLPTGVTASLSLHGYYPVGSGGAEHGNYTIKVQYDSDGDGIPDVHDPNDALRSGERYNLWRSEAQDGPIVISSLPYHDSRSSYGYQENMPGSPSRCRVYERDCDMWGCDGWDCEHYVHINPNSRDVFYRYTNSGGGRSVRVCLRPLTDWETWYGGTMYRWDSWASMLVTSTNGGSSWSYHYNCETVEEEERRCFFEGDSNEAVVSVGAGQTLIIGVTGMTDASGSDDSRSGYYNLRVCEDGTPGCACDMWDYRP
jgi:hypothetical protein